MAGDAFRAFGKIAPNFSGESERVGEGTRQCQWQFARSAGSNLHPGSPAEPSPASVDSGHFSNWAELAEELDAFAKKEESPKIRAAFTARPESRRRALASS